MNITQLYNASYRSGPFV